MLDSLRRNIDYLRISLTDRCNLRCLYCMPEDCHVLSPEQQLLSDDEIIDAVKMAVGYGIRKIRLTGGEPLLRAGVSDLVGNIAQIAGVQDLAMTTNGILLERYAMALKEAGLHRVNVSLDTTDPAAYKRLTKGGDVMKVLAGIEKALEAGLTPVKVNCVVRHSSSEHNASLVRAYGRARGLEVRFIKEMNLRTGVFYPVEGGDGGRCGSCSRIRLTADGAFKPCLFNESAYKIRELGMEKAFLMAVQNKPPAGARNASGRFNQIGG